MLTGLYKSAYFIVITFGKDSPGSHAIYNVGPAAARLLELRVRIQPGAWVFIACECCVLYR